MKLGFMNKASLVELSILGRAVQEAKAIHKAVKLSSPGGFMQPAPLRTTMGMFRRPNQRQRRKDARRRRQPLTRY